MERRGASDRANADVALIETIVVGLGSNLGARLATLRAAAVMIDALDGCRVVARSPVVETPAVGPPQPAYLNAAVRVETTHAPLELLRRLLEIERALGRERGEKWGPRTIDLDLLWRAAGPVDDPRLVVPHPRLFERSFALAPLVAVAEPAIDSAEAALARLGAPPVVGSLERPEPSAVRTLENGSLELSVATADPAEALAALAELVARALADSGFGRPAPQAGEALVIRSEPSPGPFLDAVLAACATGFSVAAVTVSHIDAEVAIGRIVGQSGPAIAETGPFVDVRALPGLWVARIDRAKVSEDCGPKH